MAELVVVGFGSLLEADLVLSELRHLEQEHLIDLEDAVVAIRQANGKVKLKQSIDLIGGGAAICASAGAIWEMMAGSLPLDSLAGFAVGGLAGAGTGALTGTATGYGIDEDFARSLSETLQPGTSALFVLVRKAQPEKVLAALSGFKGEILRASLSLKEAPLETALSGVSPAPQVSPYQA